MPERQHVEMIRQGAASWNKWRAKHPNVRPILREAMLRGVELCEANLERANIIRADLRGATLTRARLCKASLYDANLSRACLDRADLRGARLIGTDLSSASLVGADLTGADLSWANLSGADLTDANLSGSRIYAISAWDVRLDGATQRGLVITRSPENETRMRIGESMPGEESQPIITVDNLEVAQFIYLLINNGNLRHVIETISSKVVLILGRFSSDRMPILDALREKLRSCDLMPVLFDFKKPSTRDLTGTVSILAHMACFIIADLTAPRSVPHELATLVPQCVVPTLPIIQISRSHGVHRGEEPEYAMFDDLRRRYHWVLPVFGYEDETHLLNAVEERIVAPALEKARQLNGADKQHA